jgi:hypothetical protein
MAKKNEAVGHWAKAADRVILPVIRDNPDLDRKSLKSLISAEYPFGTRAMFPYKQWLKRVKYHLDCKFGWDMGPATLAEDLEAIWNTKIGA